MHSYWILCIIFAFWSKSTTNNRGPLHSKMNCQKPCKVPRARTVPYLLSSYDIPWLERVTDSWVESVVLFWTVDCCEWWQVWRHADDDAPWDVTWEVVPWVMPGVMCCCRSWWMDGEGQSVKLSELKSLWREDKVVHKNAKSKVAICQ